MIQTILSLLFAVLLGYSLTHIPWIYIPVQWEVWVGVAVACFIGIVVCLFLARAPKVPVEVPHPPDDEMKNELAQSQKEFDDFQKEIKQAFRGHLKVSIIFWSFFYKKEKVKTFEDAKNEVLQDLKKEFPNMPWMESMIEGIRQELTKYK